MKTILITGGTDGIGKGVAMHFLNKGERVIIVGTSVEKGKIFLNEARKLGAEERAFFLKANLSLIKENQRIIEEVKNQFHSLDMLVFCAASLKFRKEFSKTQEGFEFSFALTYLSRFILSYGLQELMEKAYKPVIINVASPGMKGSVNWNDLQYRKCYDGNKVQFHVSRLNDLLAVEFAQNNANGKVKYVLFHPSAVRTSGAKAMYEKPLMKILMKITYKIIGKPVEKAIIPIIELLENPPQPLLSAYKQQKKVSLTMKTFNKENAQKLFNITVKMLDKF